MIDHELLRQVLAEQAQGDPNFVAVPKRYTLTTSMPAAIMLEAMQRFKPDWRRGKRGPTGWKSEWSALDRNRVGK